LPTPLLLDVLSLVPGKGPLHRQLYAQVRALITGGDLPAGALLPSSRSLAADLRVSRNTVTSAYDQLVSEGYLEPRDRTRPRVADVGPPSRQLPAAFVTPSASGRLMLDQPRQRAEPGRVAFHPGTPDLSVFPLAEWRRLMARRLARSDSDLYGYHHLTGHPALRLAISRYLAAARGVRCRPEEILVTTGGQAALDLVARLMLDPGDTVWMEEPGYLGAQSAFLAAGAQLAPLPVTENGWDLASLPDPPPKLIYVTPSCQFPLGHTMLMEQRLRLLEVARTVGAVVLEDDFDSEYRFVGQPIPAMQGIDATGRTLYVGTFAKTMFPALRIGFIVLPGDLARRAAQAANVTGQYPPLMLQATLADFIEEGLFARHLKRTRRLYSRRRDALVAAGSAALEGLATYQPRDAGIQTLWSLDECAPDVAVAAAANARSITVAALSRHYRFGPSQNGLVLGYAAVAENALAPALEVLRSVIEEQRAAAAA
jgi:GntR family transcriptional regulator / MocR family aminotransferase